MCLFPEHEFTFAFAFAGVFQEFVSIGEVLFGGYLFHYAPFFFADRTLFLHHYLPAYVFKVRFEGFIY